MRATSGAALALMATLAAVGASSLAPPAVGQGAGDPAKGSGVFDDNCSSCHVLGGVGQGPNLVGVVGRKAGSQPGFPYTDALKASGLAWTPANLDRFLQGPKKLVPGTAMQAVVEDPTERRNLIAYLGTLKGR